MSENTGTATDTGEQTAEDTSQGGQGKNEQAQGVDGKKGPDGGQPGSVPYSRFAEVVEQRKGLESTLNSLIDGMVDELPEDMRDLVPNLPPAEKAAWIRSAKERGLFGKPEAATGSSPDAKRPGGKNVIDLTGLSPLQKMQAGYGQK